MALLNLPKIFVVGQGSAKLAVLGPGTAVPTYIPYGPWNYLSLPKYFRFLAREVLQSPQKILSPSELSAHACKCFELYK